MFCFYVAAGCLQFVGLIIADSDFLVAYHVFQISSPWVQKL